MRTRAFLSIPGLRSGKGFLIWLIVLSSFDALATDTGIRMGVVSEANPFAALLYETHPALFYAYKTVLPLLLLLLYRYIDKSSLLTRLIPAVTVIYFLLAIYHLVWLIFVFVNRF